MFDANAVNQPERDPEHDAERDDPYEGLRSSISLEELARMQGVKPVEKMDDLIPDWSEGEWDDEEDFDAIREQMRVGQIEVIRRKLAETPPTGLSPDDDYETFEREHWIRQIAAWERKQCEASHKDNENS